MCPLRLILVFLSAVLAGFFMIKNLQSQSDFADEQFPDSVSPADDQSSSKAWRATVTGFRTCVDMASGRYLWKNLVSSPS
ncbi:uncharacterized protein LOC124925898 [Impatiens glandulifera]|uniref:uncharacterized protein LOC124925898 n=1 Tax=Impatiens glandulifera TaxID=253017 RepID=UPI001FB137FC|nr:uncharacterized protein LOC124925898 [Impatiens glandulifera]